MRLLSAALLVLALAACAQDLATPPRSVSDSASTMPRTATTSVGDTASCVETYSPKTLANRRFAFEGTVTKIAEGAPDADAGATPVEVTYEVNDWFAGGDADTLTLRSWDFIVAGGPDDPVTTVGTRLLVSGDSDMAWGCGFTREFSESEADVWRAVFTT